MLRGLIKCLINKMKLTDIFYFFIILITSFGRKRTKVVGDVLNHSDQCVSLLDDFAAASSNFIYCTVKFARPVHICCSCIEYYNEVLEKHDQIIKAKAMNTSSCDQKLINQDRLEVIENSYNYFVGLWARGQCKNCFEANNNSVVPSNSTKEFGSLNSAITDCLQNHYNCTTKTYTADVCLNCSSKYYKINTFYRNLKKTLGNGNICMDIVDTMNMTRHLWSNVLHCGGSSMSIEALLATFLSFFLLLPLCFYLAAFKATRTGSSTILHQNRLSLRLREAWRNRTRSAISN